MSHTILPNSEEAEMGFLCAFVKDSVKTGGMAAEMRLTPEHFHRPANALIFDTLQDLWANNKPIDKVTVIERLSSKNLLHSIGGMPYLSDVWRYLPTSANAEYHATILRDKFSLRKVIEICGEYLRMAEQEQDDAPELLSELNAAIASLSNASVKSKSMSFRELLKDKLERIQGMKPDNSVIKTGIEKLDKESPLRMGDMPVIAGAPKAGKSILSLNIASNVASQGKPVLYISCEDKAPKVIDRLLAASAKVPIDRQEVSRMTEHDMTGIQRAMSSMQPFRFELRDDIQDIATIVSVARQTKAKWDDLALIVVDYAQLVRAKTRKNDTREQEVATVSRTLRLLSMELNAAVLLLSQQNQSGMTRESQTLEMDTTAMWQISMDKDEEEASSTRIIHIPFQRNGDSRIRFKVKFTGMYARIDNLHNE